MTKEWWITAGSIFSAGVLAACNRNQAVPPSVTIDKTTPTSRPPAADTATATRTFTALPTEARTPTLTATPDRISSDFDIKRKLFEAKEGEGVILQNVTVGNIIRAPWLFESAYITTLALQDSPGKTSQAAIILSSRCIFDALRQDGSLGKPYGVGVWKPEVPLDSLQLRVISPYSLASARPILDATRVIYKGKVLDCKEEYASDQLKAFIKRNIEKVDWENLPRDIEERLWKLLQEFLMGFSSFHTPTPGR